MIFVNVAEQAGINFQHFSGSAEKAYILEGMSGGVAWIDYDNDGWQDLYLVNGGHWDELLQGKRSVSNALYRNNGDGTFTDVTRKAGVGGSRWGMGGRTSSCVITDPTHSTEITATGRSLTSPIEPESEMAAGRLVLHSETMTPMGTWTST